MAIVCGQIEQFIGTREMSIMDAMEKIDKNAKGLLFIIDPKGILEGCISDGDIRRWIIRTGQLKGKVNDAMNCSPKWIYETQEHMGIDMMKKYQIDVIPILDIDKRIIAILTDDDNELPLRNHDELKDIPVFVMAGGKGTRLYPYTKILPKPLVPIGEMPIIERIMEYFSAQGMSRFFVSVNYKKEILKAYLNELSQYNISYVEEDRPLGTAGSIKLAEYEMPDVFYVTNCDIIVKADYSKMLEYHNQNGNDMTIIASLKNTTLPYGVLHTKEEGIITSLEEKPRQNYLVNTGMYILNRECLDFIPDGAFYHMTDLANELLKQKKKVGAFPVSENSFFDMGEFSELQRMETWLGIK
ncbi:CBS domain-containing protein [Lachnospiraceae bacterium C10]|nr:CBS domain-containing protein [Lachnospiraceae bacterium C10]